MNLYNATWENSLVSAFPSEGAVQRIQAGFKRAAAAPARTLPCCRPAPLRVCPLLPQGFFIATMVLMCALALALLALALLYIRKRGLMFIPTAL